MSKKLDKINDKVEERKFLKIAVGITVVLMILLYLLVRNAF
jgi:hypothetical protein